jgi:hypothetical protein
MVLTMLEEVNEYSLTLRCYNPVSSLSKLSRHPSLLSEISSIASLIPDARLKKAAENQGKNSSHGVQNKFSSLQNSNLTMQSSILRAREG